MCHHGRGSQCFFPLFFSYVLRGLFLLLYLAHRLLPFFYLQRVFTERVFEIIEQMYHISKQNSRWSRIIPNNVRGIPLASNWLALETDHCRSCQRPKYPIYRVDYMKSKV